MLCNFERLTRFISTILALLVLFLTVQPVCGSSFASQTEVYCEEGCADEQGQPGDDELESNCKVCNPFQQCGCCSGFTTIPQNAGFLAHTIVAYSKIQWGMAPFQLNEAPLRDFWQPPRQG